MAEGEKGYETAYREAIEELKKGDPAKIADRSGARMEGDAILLEYLGRTFKIIPPHFDVRCEKGGERVPLKIQTIILHYLKDSRGTPLSGELIDFRGIPSGIFYHPVFQATVERPLLERFGEKPEKFIEAASKLGGVKAEFGDFSVTIPALPRVPVTIILYPGDDEFPPSCKVLFDSSIRNYLVTEDVRILCEEIVRELIRSAEG